MHPLFYAATLFALATTGMPADFGSNAGLALFNLLVLVSGYSLAIAAGMAAVLARGLPLLFAQTFMMPAYWILISISAYKALWQLITRPFHWEKTEHGISRMLPGQLAGNTAEKPSEPAVTN